MAITLTKWIKQWLPVIIILALLVVSLYLVNLTTINPTSSEQYGDFLIYLNGFILVILIIAVFSNLLRAIYQWYTHQAGSRFTIRLMTGFVFLTLLPLIVVSFFSMNFIGQRIDRWFDVRIERALEDSVDLSRISLETRNQQHLYELKRLANSIQDKSRTTILELVDDWRYETQAQEVVLFGQDGRFEATSVGNMATLIPQFPAQDLYYELEQLDSYYHLEPVGEDDLFSRVAVKVNYSFDGEINRQGVLTALFPISEYEKSLARSVDIAQKEYKELRFQRELIKDSFRLTLFVIMVLTVLFALWAAFVFSRRLTNPVRVLVEGTLAVAAGDLDKKLPVLERDDFSSLARSFNTMTRRLSAAQQEREQARRQLQQEHDYLFVVLEHLTSGVITLDDQLVIQRINSAASTILELPLQQFVGKTLQEAAQCCNEIAPLVQVVQPYLKIDTTEWQAEVHLEFKGKRRTLACRGAGLPRDTEQLGYVLVFDDISELIQAEHDAAWSEVARRLAHEIKNPLTPIQLSAERLARKLKHELNEESGQFLVRMTHTIVQQVDALKSMVNAFSEYAKAPALVLQDADLNQLVLNVVDLYRTNEQQVTLNTSLQLHQRVRVDVNRMRQLLVNLIKNALEAISEHSEQGLEAVITLSTQEVTVKGQHFAELVVRDSGPGINPELLPKLFDPYVTTKHKGTGLGLAIVKKIVEEHGGQISAHNHEVKGAMITLLIPIRAPQLRGV
ncbi:MAG: ATP-binding protein [Thiofilum sp.]|uniref:sensor histidine kinase n=1 Tax=Thiofilum sp. TaxID=2212733 RepID=UPI0025F4ABE8|nr:ATP-binding protein [Thiofilum sp.]MBK8452847.1 HAMP domain-containing protein [Thiofilum sp.]